MDMQQDMPTNRRRSLWRRLLPALGLIFTLGFPSIGWCGTWVEICNKGDIDLSLVTVDVPYFGSNKLQYFFGLDAGKCWTGYEQSMDKSIGFVASDDKKRVYTFMPRAPGRPRDTYTFSGPDNESEVFQSEKKVCIDSEKSERSQGSWVELAHCPLGKILVPLAWQVFADGKFTFNGTYRFWLEVRPHKDDLIPVKPPAPAIGQALPPAPAPDTPPRVQVARDYPEGTVFGRLPDPTALAIPVFKEPGGVWKRKDNEVPIKAGYEAAIATRSFPDSPIIRGAWITVIATKVKEMCKKNRSIDFEESYPSEVTYSDPDASFLGVTSLSASITNLDISRMMIYVINGCRVIVFPCKNDAKCSIGLTPTSIQSLYGFGLTVRDYGSTDLNDRKTAEIVNAFRVLSTGAP